jgi:hypothetical protein
MISAAVGGFFSGAAPIVKAAAARIEKARIL